MTYYLGGIVILTAIVCYLWGYRAGSNRDLPVKRINERLNDEDKLGAYSRKCIELSQSSAEASLARYYLKQIVDGLDGQQSGAAVKAVRLARMGLGE